jgi:hypothetical protein
VRHHQQQQQQQQQADVVWLCGLWHARVCSGRPSRWLASIGRAWCSSEERGLPQQPSMEAESCTTAVPRLCNLGTTGCEFNGGEAMEAHAAPGLAAGGQQEDSNRSSSTSGSNSSMLACILGQPGQSAGSRQAVRTRHRPPPIA